MSDSETSKIDEVTRQVEALEAQIEELKIDNEGLEISLTIATEHADAVQDELSESNKKLHQQGEFIRRTFGRYLSDDIVNAILESPDGLDMGGEQRTITIMMTDLRGFTAMSERMQAQEIVSLLNDYLSEMTDIIMKWGGTIDEFIGDAILAMFGAPYAREDDPQRAVACALEMQMAMEKVNQRNHERGLPKLSMGIGINTGEVVVGNVGCLKRTKYGIVGKNVNLTARIESYTVGGQTLISDATREQCGDLIVLGDSREVSPKGVAHPITIYEALGIGGEYNVMLPEKQPLEYTHLKEALPFTYVILEGKDAGEEVYSSSLVAIEPDMNALIRMAPGVLIKDMNIKMDLAIGSEKGDVYAKVMKVADDNEDVQLALTAIPPEIESQLQRMFEE